VTGMGDRMFQATIKGDLHIQVPERLAKIYTDFEPLTTQTICETLKPGDVFLDIGANFGFFSVLAASLVGPAGQVYAVEASPRVLPVLSANTAAWTNVTIINAAAGDHTGVTEFHLTEDFVNSGIALSPFIGESTKVSVPIDRLDNLLSDAFGFEGRVDFVKCDVQGDEFAVLDGLRGTISANPSLRLIVEWAPAWMDNAGYDGRSVPEFLRGLGFQQIVVIDDYLRKRMTVAEMEEDFRRDTTGKRFCNVLAFS
jgi:FkbM family methyltransferase